MNLSSLQTTASNQWKFGAIVAGLLFTGLSFKAYRAFWGGQTLNPLSLLALEPVQAATLKEANKVIERDRDHEAPPEAIRSLGQNLVGVAENNASPIAKDAWSTLVKLVNYKSAQNSRANPVPPNLPAASHCLFAGAIWRAPG